MSEHAIALDPQPCSWSAGSPSPVVLSSESRSFLVFDQRDGSSPSPPVAAIEFSDCLALTSGFPNDEALHGHRLWNRGLEFYMVHEVVDSSWLAEMRTIERQHDQSPEVPFEHLRHYVLTFHDSTIEALATALILTGAYPSMTEAIANLVGELNV